MTTTYLLTELRRVYRNPRYLFFTIGVPVILFLVIGNAFEGKLFGVSAQTWYMVNMGVFGATGAVLGIGARIADERDRGWNRQLRLTPLPPLGYVMGKVLTGMLVALPALAAGLPGRRADRRGPPEHAAVGAGHRPRLARDPADGRRRASGSATSPRATTPRR